MKEFTFRIVLIVAAIAISVFYLYPTYQDYQNQQELNQTLSVKRDSLRTAHPGMDADSLDRLLRIVETSLKSGNQDFVDTRAKRIKLGLDLQGGMRVVLEVNTGELLRKLGKGIDEDFLSVLAASEIEKQATDESIVDIFARKLKEKNILITRYFGTIEEDEEEVISKLKQQAEDAVSRAVEIIGNRVNQYGVSEPSIQRQGTRRIIVELPGIANEEEARQLIQGTALLEFKIVKQPQEAFAILQNVNDVLAGVAVDVKTDADTAIVSDTTAKKDTTQTAKVDTTKADTNKTMTQEEFQKKNPLFAILMIDEQSGIFYLDGLNRSKFQEYLMRPEVRRVVPSNLDFVTSAKPSFVNEGREFYEVIMTAKEADLTGNVITDALATIDQTSSRWVVSMAMNSEGATRWATITDRNIKKRCAIVLDGVFYSAPTIQNKITGGRSEISGVGEKEAKLLEIVLRAGALPAPVDIIEERTVGPSLGQDSVGGGLYSMLFGYILVALFMIIYYQRSGSVAAIMLFFTIFFVLGVLAAFKAALTLPGIAGLVLTMGMAVDSNVLIYERIREELATGKTVKAAIESGFAHASSAIWDSNITTFITGIILYQFGSGPVQGFALTLMIGIGTSLFGALVMARLALQMMVAKGMKITIG